MIYHPDTIDTQEIDEGLGIVVSLPADMLTTLLKAWFTVNLPVTRAQLEAALGDVEKGDSLMDALRRNAPAAYWAVEYKALVSNLRSIVRAGQFDRLESLVSKL